MVSDKGSGERHRHECPVCGADVPCVAPLPHRVGHPPPTGIKIKLSTVVEEPEQRYKLCEKCAARESKEKDLKGVLGGNVAILSQLLERLWPSINPVDVLAKAYVTRRVLPKTALDRLLDPSYGLTKEQTRHLALLDYLEGDPGLTVKRRYPKADFPSTRALVQAAYRLRKKLTR